jgi:Na+/phosphate symporter
VVLLLPGYLLARWVLPTSTLAELLGLVPALSLVALGLAGTVALAFVRAPFSAPLAWAVVVALSVVLTPAAARRRS